MGSPNCSEGGRGERGEREYGVGSLNSEREGCRVIKEKEEVQEGNKRLEEKGVFEDERVVLHLKSNSTHTTCE